MSESWKPKNGDAYYFICANGDVNDNIWKNGLTDRKLFRQGNCFKTKEEAQAAAEKTKALLLGLHETVTDCNPLPKLTAEIFDRPDCPEWAQYAAVDMNGIAYYYDDKPFPTETFFYNKCAYHQMIEGDFDASDWENSLIERPAKETKLPDWCKVGEWVYDGIREKYRKIIRIDMTIKGCSPVIFFNEAADLLCPSMQLNSIGGRFLRPARPRPYNADEMRGLVGKVVDKKDGDSFLVTAYTPKLDSRNLSAVSIDDMWVMADDVLECYTIAGNPAGVLEHLNEKGEWVQ